MTTTQTSPSLNDIACREHEKLVREQKAQAIREFRDAAWRQFFKKNLFTF